MAPLLSAATHEPEYRTTYRHAIIPLLYHEWICLIDGYSILPHL